MNFARHTCFALALTSFHLSLAPWADVRADTPEGRYSLAQFYTRETTVALHREASSMIADHEKRLKKAKAADDGGAEDDLKDALEILEYTEGWLARALDPAASEKVRYEANTSADRILQTVEDPVVGEFSPPMPEFLKNVVLGNLFGQPLPGMSEARRQRPLGEAGAAKEAANLYASGRDSFFSIGELAALNPEQISALDISPDHPFWYDRAGFSRLRPDPVGYFESLLAHGITEALRSKGDLKKSETYPRDAARKVLFIENIYHSATSPKGRADDAFGVSWKLKWGPETSVEPVACRLYLLAGGKMTDLTVSGGSGPSDLILVLRDPEDAAAEKEKDDEAYPATVEELKSGLQTFYGFDLEPFIHSQGIVTKENVHSLLRHLPAGGKKKYQKDKVIGREWVAFHESGLELRTKGFVRRHDGSRMSDPQAVADRAVRGSYVFDMWIGNRDVKDDNNKAFFVKEKEGKKMEIAEYREGHHDLGLALGTLFAAGEVNGFKTGRRFARRGLFGKIRFTQSIIFRPTAWDAATWADGKWMARNIVAITDEQIREAANASGWPDFSNQALAWKLIDRRNRLAEIFDLSGELAASTEIEAPSLTVALGTPEQIAAAERRYLLPPGSLAQELAWMKVGPGYAETVLAKGQIANCRHSALIRIIERHRHPSGLPHRYKLMSHKEPKCLRP